MRLRQSTVDVLAGDSILDQSEHETGIEIIAGSDSAHRLHLLRKITLGKAVLGTNLYRLSFLIMASIVVITLIFGYFSLSKKHHQQKMGNELVTE